MSAVLATPPSVLDLASVAAQAGCSPRALQHWCEVGYVGREWSRTEVAVAIRLAALERAGFRPEVAADLARRSVETDVSVFDRGDGVSIHITPRTESHEVATALIERPSEAAERDAGFRLRADGSTEILTAGPIAGTPVGSAFDVVLVDDNRLGLREIRRQPQSGRAVGATWQSKPGAYRDFSGPEFSYRLVGRACLTALSIDADGVVHSAYDCSGIDAELLEDPALRVAF